MTTDKRQTWDFDNDAHAAEVARAAAEQSRRAAALGEQLGMFDVTTDLVEPGMNGVIF